MICVSLFLSAETSAVKLGFSKRTSPYSPAISLTTDSAKPQISKTSALTFILSKSEMECKNKSFVSFETSSHLRIITEMYFSRFSGVESILACKPSAYALIDAIGVFMS